METIQAMLGELWAVWTEMFTAIRGFVGKAIVVILWIICGIIVLPCVYVAGNLYPKWTEWGEKL